MSGLTEAQRGMLMSAMSPESCALMVGKSVAWVKRHRAALAELPQASPVQVRAAVAAKPWAPEEDPFAPPATVVETETGPVVVCPGVAVVQSMHSGDVQVVPPPAQTWREAAIEAVRLHPSPSAPPRPEARGPGRPRKALTDHGQKTVQGMREARRLGLPVERAVRSSEAARAKPEGLPRDPAIVSEERHERQFVEAKRRAGVSWFNIAKMTRKTAPYLKAIYGDGMGW